MAASASAKEAIWLAGFLFELLMSPNGSKPITVQIYGDNRGSLILSKSSAFHPRSKHINIRHHFIREAVNNGSVRFDYMPTEQLPADAFTKALFEPVEFEKCSFASDDEFPSRCVEKLPRLLRLGISDEGD
jgi:hypothetical protein